MKPTPAPARCVRCGKALPEKPYTMASRSGPAKKFCSKECIKEVEGELANMRGFAGG